MISLFTRPRFPVKYPCDDYKVACPDHQCIRRNAELMDPVIFPTLTPSEQASLCGPATFSESVFEALASRRNSLLVPFLTCLSRIHIYWIPSTSMKFHQSICALCSAFASWGRHRPTPKISPYSCHLRLPCAWSWQFLAGPSCGSPSRAPWNLYRGQMTYLFWHTFRNFRFHI